MRIMNYSDRIDFIKSKRIQNIIRDTASLDDVFAIFEAEDPSASAADLSAIFLVEYRILPTDYLFRTIPTCIYDSGQPLDKITVQEGVTELAVAAFDFATIKELYLPKSLRRLARACMPGGSTKIYYAGTTDDFEAIEKQLDWNPGDLPIICIDGILKYI